MMIKKDIAALLLAILGLLMVFGTSIVKAQDSLSLFQTMARKGPLEITIKTDQKKLIRKKLKEEYQPATLTYQDLEGNPVEREIEVKTRGNMRLKTCYYPPIRIKISDADIESEGLKHYSKLKLVVTCKPGDDYQQMVLREYLAYKIRNIIDDYGFRVQLVSLHMEDSEGKQKPRELLAFVIEDEDEMSARLGGKIYDPRSVSRRSLYQEAYAMLSIFQYLIGNTDWFVLNKHNTKFVRTENPPAIIPIAYDFDFAGLVNAPYAVPNEKMPITSVRDRFFIGDCGVEGQYEEVIKKLSSKKSEIFDLVENCTYLNDRSRASLIKYLTESFEILEDPIDLAKAIKRGCGWSPINH